MKTFNLLLSADEINLLLACVNEMPRKTVNTLAIKIETQINNQIDNFKNDSLKDSKDTKKQ